MNRIFSTIVILFSTILVLSGQTRDLDNYSKVRVSGNIKVNLIEDSSNKADIEIIRGDYDKLKTDVVNGVLTIKFKSKGLWGGNNNDKAKIDLYYTGIESLDVNAGASLKGSDVLSAKDMDIDVSSGASCDVEIEASSVDIDVSSGASLSVRGKGGELEADVSSGARLSASKLVCGKVDVDVSSGGSASVHATDHIVAEADSGGSVKYKGNPKKKDIDAGKYSGGSVKAIN